jgi:hypothetical protein
MKINTNLCGCHTLPLKTSKINITQAIESPLHKGVKMQKGASVLIWWQIMLVPSTETTHSRSNKSPLHAYHSVNVNTKNIERVPQKLEYASCVWNPFYDFSVDRVVRVYRRFIRYAMRGFG